MTSACLRLSRLPLALALTLAAGQSVMAREAIPSSTTLSIMTMNIKYFGLNGNPNSTTPESRVDTIRTHLTRENLLTDVMIFEEIVNVDMLANEVLGSGYRCQSYDHPNPEHQHVAVCFKSKYKFEIASDDDNFLLEDVTMGEDRYRPVVHGILKTRSGKSLLHVMGAHLKAFPDMGTVRVQQADIIAQYIDSRTDGVPVVLAGDFNTYGDDDATLNAIFSPVAEGMKEAVTTGQFTWKSASQGQKFDHVWLSSNLQMSTARIAGPCNSNDSAVVSLYNQQVSDHCPVTMTVTLAASTVQR